MEKSQTVKLLEEIMPKSGKYLDLSENFEKYWEKLENNVKEAEEIFLILGQSAGFTDSRIIYMWLKGENYFNQKDLFIDFASDLNLDFENEFNSLVTCLKLGKILTQACEKNNQSLSYSKEANIGKNPINSQA